MPHEILVPDATDAATAAADVSNDFTGPDIGADADCGDEPPSGHILFEPRKGQVELMAFWLPAGVTPAAIGVGA